MAFATIQGLSAHLWRAHKQRSKERAYMTGTTCQACNVCFWTSSRLQQHLKRSQTDPAGCYFQLSRVMDPRGTEDEPSVNEIPPTLQSVDRLPARRACGPTYLPSTTPWQRRHAEEGKRLRETWNFHGFPLTLDPEVCAEVSTALTAVTDQWICQHPSMETQDDSLFYQWMVTVFPTNAEDDMRLWAFLHWGQRPMYDLLDKLEDPDQIQFIESEFMLAADPFPMWTNLLQWDRWEHAIEPPPIAFTPPLAPLPDRRGHGLREPLPSVWNDQCAFLRTLSTRQIVHLPEEPGVPLIRDADGQLHMYVVHLFSGRRRDHDLHDQLHRVISTHFKDVRLHVLSVDTAVGGELCNMMQQAFHSVMRLAQLAAIALVITGPPCETWTSARHLELPDKAGPRPIRSAERPWGLNALSNSETRQVAVGSALYARSAQIEVQAVLNGAGSIMEHPSEPRDESFASVWRTNLQRFFLGKLWQPRICAIQQYRYGADTVKPTFLRAIALKGFAGAFLQHGNHQAPRPTARLGGYDIFNHAYRTASAKEYPAPMCMALADAALWALAQRQLRKGTVISHLADWPQELLTWAASVEQCGQDVFAPHFRPDYQPV
eukprot:Skav227383  [mRNA]  locus=scaffold3148:30474:32282:+ [translate_table: standard]